MSVISKLLEEDKVWIAIQTNLIGSKRSGSKTIFNCPMCVTRGETPDRRMRGALWYDASGVGIKCFNCAFNARYKIGTLMSKNVEGFLKAIGVGNTEVARLKYWALNVHRQVQGTSYGSQNPQIPAIIPPAFPTRSLPVGARSIEDLANSNCNDSDFLNAVEYLWNRGSEVFHATTYYWTPNKLYNLNKRIIIPCMFEGNIVGWIARATVKNIEPKYHKDTPPNYLFNIAALTNPNRRYAILVEGIFDALAIDGVGILGADVDEKHIQWIKNSGKEIISLPDRDKAGSRLIDYSLVNNWQVSNPRAPATGANVGWWDSDVKDAAQAAQRYGRLYTLRSIMESSTGDRLQIRLFQKDFASTFK